MERTQDGNNFVNRPSFKAVVLVVILTCVQIACFVQVHWTLYTYRIEIDGLVKRMDYKHQSSEKEGVFVRRVKRSQDTPLVPGKHSKSTSNSHLNVQLIRSEVSKELKHLLKTRICVNNKKVCIRGPRGRRGKTGKRGRRGSPGPKGPRGPVGKHGPAGTPCKKCNITVDDLKTLITKLGPQGLPAFRGPPGLKGEKGDPGKEVSLVSISIPPKSVVVNESGMASLYCGAKGFPTPRVTWKKVNSSLPLSGRHVVDVNGGLLIRNVKKSDQGTYKCTAKNIFPGEATAYATVIVQDATKIIQNQLTPIITEEGQNVTLTCVASGTPPPTITWSKGFSSLPNGRYDISQHIEKRKEHGMLWKDNVVTSNLTLINLSLGDNGLFICKAVNKLSSDQAMTQLVVVKRIYFTMEPPSKLKVIAGKTVQIDCQAANAKEPTWIQPTRDATNVNVFSNGSLVITKATKQNEGNYKCIARNNYRQIFAVTYVSVDDVRGLEKSAILSNHGDKRYFQHLLDYLAPVLKSSRTSRWQRCWHAAMDGWDVKTKFHAQCDGKGPTVTLVRVGKYVFGGYTDVSWHTNGTYSRSSRSFLFTLYSINGYQPIKLGLTGQNNQYAIYGTSILGPTFGGGHDIAIYNQASSNKNSYTSPHSYKSPVSNSFLAGSYKFTPNDVEVFYEMT